MGLDYEMQLTMSGVMNICQVVACVWSLWGMDRFGRRKLLLGGAVCMFLAHFIISILVGKYNGKWTEHTDAGWASAALILFFMLSFGATWGPIPWAMPAEIFPSSLRAKGCAFGTMSNWGNNFIIVSTIGILKVSATLLIRLGVDHTSNAPEHWFWYLCLLLLLQRSIWDMGIFPCP
jgi:MFS family permease